MVTQATSRTNLITNLHVVSCGAEPLEEEDGESRDLDRGEGDKEPRGRIERLWKYIPYVQEVLTNFI